MLSVIVLFVPSAFENNGSMKFWRYTFSFSSPFSATIFEFPERVKELPCKVVETGVGRMRGNLSGDNKDTPACWSKRQKASGKGLLSSGDS